MKIGEYVKSMVALVITLATALQGYLDDGLVSGDEWRAIGSLALATVAVAVLPNQSKPGQPVQPVPVPPQDAPTVSMRSTSGPASTGQIWGTE